MSNKSFPWSLIAVSAIAGAGLAGVANYVTSIRASDVPNVQERISPPNTIAPGQESVTNTEPTSQSQQSLSERLSADITQELKNRNMGRIRVIGVAVTKGNAVLDMNSAVLNGFGSQEESSFIEVIRKNLSGYDSIKTFQIRVDGEILTSLSHFEMIEPVPVR
ncbi:MAG TPA: GerMN domain-containing protein [Fimbriimonas sp.]|nr:GerMN domain-containing protein [Fimbriimonas sp.]